MIKVCFMSQWKATFYASVLYLANKNTSHTCILQSEYNTQCLWNGNCPTQIFLRNTLPNCMSLFLIMPMKCQRYLSPRNQKFKRIMVLSYNSWCPCPTFSHYLQSVDIKMLPTYGSQQEYQNESCGIVYSDKTAVRNSLWWDRCERG